MKKILFFVLLFCHQIAIAHNDTYHKLVEVNKCWNEQKDININRFEGLCATTEKDWIRIHLSLVEQTLRARSTRHLNAAQEANRAHCLEILNRYWQEGNFPINDQYAYRTPIFIDPYNNFCAVGFLMKETGYEHISRMISSKTNLAYVREMNYPELGNWAIENGFSIDELAWIQPGYPPESRCGKIGKGVDGFVQELYVDTNTQLLYVGGQFYQADKSFVANNIAYVTENAGVYTWHKMGNGVNGRVNAVTKFEDKIFVAGSFDSASGIEANNIAYWDGSTWHSAGCIDGMVNDLTVFEGVLYAAGNFKSCGTDLGKNFAQWNGTKWTMIPGIEGKINTLEGFKDYLVLGGKFDFDTAINANAIKWNPTSSFQQFDNKIKNEVMDFESYKDTLHLVCKNIKSIDTFQLFQKLSGNHWINFLEPGSYSYAFGPKTDSNSFNTLCAETKSINIGGYFTVYWGMSYGKNTINFGSYWANVDSTVNKMVLFKNELILGGKFKTGMEYTPYGGTKIELNGITKRLRWKLSIPENSNKETTFKIYPNPIQSGSIIHTENNFGATQFSISNIEGKLIQKGKLMSSNEIQLAQLSAGIYLLEISNAEGKKARQKMSIQ